MSDIKSDILKVSPTIYYSTLNCKARRIIHQGGQWSGKTVNILASLATHAARNRKEVTTVTGVTLPHLKSGALRDFKDLVYPDFIRYMPSKEKERWNKTDNIFTFNSGSIIEFKSYENEFKARGAKRHRLFVNEANLMPEMTFYQLDSRTAIQTIIDYNPTASFWAHDKYIGTEGNQLFISDHRDNPFLSEEKHREIENISDPELWKVYARGATGNITGLIYPSWKRIPDSEFYNLVSSLPYMFGVDFGFNDETAITKVYYTGNLRFVEELAYEPDLDPFEIQKILMANGYNEYTNVYCDHNNKKARAILRRIGINNAIRAQKGQFSINMGIQYINKNCKVYYPESSVNLHKERGRYIWLKDKETGKSTNTPIDAFNHLLDSARYAIYSHAAPQTGE